MCPSVRKHGGISQLLLKIYGWHFSLIRNLCPSVRKQGGIPQLLFKIYGGHFWWRFYFLISIKYMIYTVGLKSCYQINRYIMNVLYSFQSLQYLDIYFAKYFKQLHYWKYSSFLIHIFTDSYYSAPLRFIYGVKIWVSMCC